MVKRRSSQVAVRDTTKRHASGHQAAPKGGGGPKNINIAETMAKYSAQNRFQFCKRQIVHIPIENARYDSAGAESKRKEYKDMLWTRCKTYIDQLLGSSGRPSFALEDAYRSSTEVYHMGVRDELNEYLQSRMEYHLKDLFSEANWTDPIDILSRCDSWLSRVTHVSELLVCFDWDYLSGRGKQDIKSRAIAQLTTQVFEKKLEDFKEPCLVLSILSALKMVRNVKADLQNEEVSKCVKTLKLFSKVMRRCHMLESWLEPQYLSQAGVPSWVDKYSIGQLDCALSAEVELETKIGSEILEFEPRIVNQSVVARIMLRINGTGALDNLADVIAYQWNNRTAKAGPPKLWSYICIACESDHEMFSEKLIPNFKAAMIVRGATVMEECSASQFKNLVFRLLELYISCDSLIDSTVTYATASSLLQTKSSLRTAMRAGFRELFSNENWSFKAAEKLAKFCDEILTGKRAGVSQLELDDFGVLVKIVLILRCIEERDVFEKNYQRDYARRLLQGKCISSVLEEKMMNELRDSSHPEFVKYLQKMTEEVKTSHDFTRDFISRQPTCKPLSVNVLDKTYWPSYPESHLTAPKDVVAMQEKFEEFYLSKNSKRKLRWSNDLAQCILRANFGDASHELQVNGLQACILMALGESDSETSGISFERIHHTCGVNTNSDMILRALESLCFGKYLLICKTGGQQAKCSVNDKYWINAKFSDPAFRIKVQLHSSAGNQEQKKLQKHEIVVDRRHRIRASIIRAAKEHGTLNRSQLIQLVIADTKQQGTLTYTDIEQEISFCVERSYLSQEGNIFKYI